MSKKKKKKNRKKNKGSTFGQSWKKEQEQMHQAHNQEIGILRKEVTDFFLKYSFESLYQHIVSLMYHPDNAMFEVRFDFLVLILLQLKDPHFENQTLPLPEFNQFIKDYFNKTEKYSTMIEDYRPYDQRKHIPLFFEGKAYEYFFIGSDCSFQGWDEFKSIYLENIKNPEVHGLKELFLSILDFQKQLLSKVFFVPLEPAQEENILTFPNEAYYLNTNSVFEYKANDECKRGQGMLNEFK